MSAPVLVADNPAVNRKVWANWLRRPDWANVPTREGDVQECRAPWDVGLELATEHWLSSADVIANDQYVYEEDVEEVLMTGCYGIQGDHSFDPQELPDRIRNRMMMAIQAAQSAPRSENVFANLDVNSIAEMDELEEWNLIIISGGLIGMWNADSSPMSGAIMSPADVARLIADILDAAPPSLLTPAAEE